MNLSREEELDLQRVSQKLGDDSLPVDGMEQIIREGDYIFYGSLPYPPSYRIGKVLKIGSRHRKYAISPETYVKVRSVVVYRLYQKGEFRLPRLSSRCVYLEAFHKVIVINPKTIRQDVLDMLSRVV